MTFYEGASVFIARSSGIFYLSVRHVVANPPMLWVQVDALTVVGVIACIVA